MLERALELGVEVHINSFVTNLDFNDPPKVTVQGGKIYTADLVVGCDGLRSVCRENLVGHADPPHETGDIAYRILVTADQMRPYPELHELLDDPAINVWMGPRGHAVCYLLKGGNLYNIVLMYWSPIFQLLTEIVHLMISLLMSILPKVKLKRCVQRSAIGIQS